MKKLGKVEFAARLLMVESMVAMARANLLLCQYGDLARSLAITKAGVDLLFAHDVTVEGYFPAEKKRAATKPRKRSERNG